jgi:glucose/arabinose dehydrogenase
MKIPRLAAAVALLLFSMVGSAQQQVPFRNNIPVAPTGLASRPLPDKPIVYDTAEGQKIRVVVVAKGLTYPWSLAFLPDGGMLVTERTGKLRIIRNGVLDPKPVEGVPASVYAGKSGDPGAVHGLMDLALHPKFADNHFVYLTYTKPLPNDKTTIALARGTWNGKALTDVRDIFVMEPGAGASRIAFGRDGTCLLYTLTLPTIA